MKKIFIILLALINCSFGYGQGSGGGVGTWRYHLPSSSVTTLALVNGYIYAASPFSSGFLDTEDFSYSSFNKVDGLSDIGINQLKFSPKTRQLIIAYENGNLDLYKDGELVNVNDILRSSAISGSKKINHIALDGNQALLSADFGLAFINLERFEVRRTVLNLTPDGTVNPIYASTLNSYKDSIFIATEDGLFSAPYNASVNLLDYNNWHKYSEDEGMPLQEVRGVINFNDTIYASVNKDGVYKLHGETWERTELIGEGEEIRSLYVNNETLLICAANYILKLAKDGSSEKVKHKNIVEPTAAIFDGSGALWVGDKSSGLLRVKGGSVDFYNPNGPVTADCFNIYSYNGKVLTLTGGYTRSYVPFYRTTGMFELKNNRWSIINSGWVPGFPYAVDFVDAVYNPSDRNLYIATYITGLITAKHDGGFKITGSEVFEPVSSSDQVRVSCVAYDSRGKLWVGNHSVPSGKPSLLSKDLQGEWQKYTFPENDARSPVQIVIDDMDNKWIRLGNAGNVRGIMVFNEDGNQRRFFNASQGGLPNRNVNCLAKAKTGEIWAGTNEGIAVFQNPARAFDRSFEFHLPIYEGFPLLNTQVINDIAVDGGNRKWVATNNGVWLLNPSGTETIHRFNASNSPLLSDLVSTIGINGETGEVFFGTDKGVCSFRGSATEAQRQHSDVIVFPNPVENGFSGEVGIKGLVRDAYVKITDIYGQLIYETRANGGMAVWNVRNYDGQRAKPGVYLIFSSDAQGEETLVSKMAVLH
ncbi:hypothetical protein RCC89_00680 [Cytophagaceae bacterium ABcell3]|nr:hypothetical protein RCC89_00680 [Cytophagaceae bacterium ABcell3]